MHFSHNEGYSEVGEVVRSEAVHVSCCLMRDFEILLRRMLGFLQI